MKLPGDRLSHLTCASLAILINYAPVAAAQGNEASVSAAELDKNAYNALTSLAHITSKQVTQNGCSVTAVADFQEYTKHLSLFREAWLNRDYSFDFYNHRRKQVFIFSVLKKYAELITEGLYTESLTNSPDECSFQIEIRAQDLYGNTSQLPAISWTFSRRQADRVVWNNFDPGDFPTIAINYKQSEYMDAWVSIEPSMRHSKSRQELPPVCDDKYIKHDAIFTRATVFWGRTTWIALPGIMLMRCLTVASGLTSSGWCRKYRRPLRSLTI